MATETVTEYETVEREREVTLCDICECEADEFVDVTASRDGKWKSVDHDVCVGCIEDNYDGDDWLTQLRLNPLVEDTRSVYDRVNDSLDGRKGGYLRTGVYLLTAASVFYFIPLLALPLTLAIATGAALSEDDPDFRAISFSIGIMVTGSIAALLLMIHGMLDAHGAAMPLWDWAVNADGKADFVRWHLLP